MSIAPETDLGVVGATVPTEQVESAVAEQALEESLIATDTAESSDVPSIDAVIAEPATDDAAGDLPAIEPGTEAADETAGDDG